ncbi:MAG TPA: DUF4893 domain-containing protein [Sphingomonas sp.]|jgi:hypothetical protein|nr:DUF4893 domain-containing protein [Sphingomonas sp.]
MRRTACLLALCALPIAGCATVPVPPPVAQASVTIGSEEAAWNITATVADRDRIAALPAVWAQARAAVPRRLRAKLQQEGALVDPAAALEAPTLPPGPYHCRLVRFGGRAGFASYAPDFCYVEVDKNSLAFTKQTGTNLPVGWLFADTDHRQVFLGSFKQPGKGTAPAYGNDPSRDVAGVVERVAPFRWRLVLTRAGNGAALDIYELVPVTPLVPGAKPAVPAPEGPPATS